MRAYSPILFALLVACSTQNRGSHSETAKSSADTTADAQNEAAHRERQEKLIVMMRDGGIPMPEPDHA